MAVHAGHQEKATGSQGRDIPGRYSAAGAQTESAVGGFSQEGPGQMSYELVAMGEHKKPVGVGTCYTASNLPWV